MTDDDPLPPGPAALDDRHAPIYSIGQVAGLLDVQQAFLRRIEEQHLLSPGRSEGGQRRYSRFDIGRARHVADMADEGMTLPSIRRIIELEHELAEITRERDELAARLRALHARHPAEQLDRPGRPT
ncbi:MerR family transcriptional regulator [Actinomadura parmotrematis]|uniref:MerR family transcriptional regulator n=1 Tax=Actinomadura parmotrematis TaxID=2864039 RepID=A0ABS7G503_9ACTN|nr:MerR family transcriptional regulator [Actinomadura parmotrematis]MBW8486939.1 MerR family transcriptional regulator [Actinomadura parmotrematis]